MDIFNIASALFGSSRIEDSSSLSNTVDSISAVGATASSDGAVGITMDADVTPADDIDGEDTDQTIIDVPTSPAVDVEDDLILGLTGDGPLKVPVVIANPGSGDRQQAQINSAVGLAEAAEAVASATGQHFWTDGSGVHVTEVTQDEWEDADGVNYHSGANVLINSLGQLFRNGLNNLMALLPTGFAYYDGNGNADNNIIVSFLTEAESRFNRVTKISLGSSTNFPSMLLIKGGAGTYLNRAVGILIGDGSGGTSEPMAGVNVVMDDAAGRYDEIPLARTFVFADADAIVVNGSPHSMDNLDAALRVSSTQETTWSRTGASSGSCPCRHNGIVCTVTGYDVLLSSALATGSAVNIGTVPAGWRPLGTVVTPVATNGTQSGRLWASINSDGLIRLYNYSGSSIATTTHLYFTMTYVI